MIMSRRDAGGPGEDGREPNASLRARRWERDSMAAGINASRATAPTTMKVSEKAISWALMFRIAPRYSSAPAFCCW